MAKSNPKYTKQERKKLQTIIKRCEKEGYGHSNVYIAEQANKAGLATPSGYEITPEFVGRQKLLMANTKKSRRPEGIQKTRTQRMTYDPKGTEAETLRQLRSIDSADFLTEEEKSMLIKKRLQ